MTGRGLVAGTILLFFAAALGGYFGTRGGLRAGVSAELDRSNPPGPVPGASLSLLEDSLRRTNEVVDQLKAERVELEAMSESWRERAVLSEARAVEAEEAAKVSLREAMALRNVLLEEDLRYRSIIEGLKRWEVLPADVRFGGPDDPTPVEESLGVAAPPMEPLSTQDESQTPTGSADGPEESSTSRDDEVIVDPARAKEVLNRIMTDLGGETRYELEKIEAVVGTELLGVVVREVDANGRLRRRFFADRGRFRMLLNENELALNLEAGRIEEASLKIPFFNGRYLLKLGRTDPAAWPPEAEPFIDRVESP